MKYEIKNAIIEKAVLSRGDRSILTAWLYLSFGGTSQAFGGYTLYLPKSFKHHEIQSCAGHFIFRVMEVAGVDNWSDLVGKTIRVNGDWNKIIAIGHIVNEDWFNPSKDFEEIRLRALKHQSDFVDKVIKAGNGPLLP